MTVSNFFQFIFGFILGVLLLVAGSVGAAFFFFNRMASAPPKPVFSETIPESPVKPETKSTDSTTESKTVEKKSEPKKEEEEEMPANAYKAKVSWSGGLSLRAEPSLEAERVGGVDYNTEVLVIKESDDKVWQQIRLSDGTEAWIKAGNLKKIDP
jgi:hypothetical protein